MRAESGLQNNLRQVRARIGLSQQELAMQAGVTRQSISALEAGQYAPSAAVALRLARVLGCRVEDLFWLEEDLPAVEAVPAEGTPVRPGGRVSLARIGGRWVAHGLDGDAAFRLVLTPADGTVAAAPQRGRPAGTVRVQLLEEQEGLYGTVMLAGCTPAMSLWAQAAERRYPGLRVLWTFANSMEALGALGRGEVHAAGVHLYDPASGEHNTPFVRQALPGRAAVLVNLGVWAEGLLVQPGNPKGLREAADLAQVGVRVVNREEGAGCRFMLERRLREAGVAPQAVSGFDDVVRGHLEVARRVAAGTADAGVSTASVAALFGLAFVPWQQVRYDLVILKEYVEEAPVRQLLGTLSHRRIRSQLAALGGYDTAHTGDIVAEIQPGGAPCGLS